MSRGDYEADICARVRDARPVPFRSVSVGDWYPKVAECHENVDVWVRAYAGTSAVRGWVTYASFGGDSVGLTAHSVVRAADGQLFDITPLGNESSRGAMRFVEHVGDEQAFFEMKAASICIHCFVRNLDAAAWDGTIDTDEDGFE